MFDDEENELNGEPELSLILPAKFIPDYTIVSKVGGESQFELRSKFPVYSKVKGVSISVKNDEDSPVKFLMSRTVDVVSEDTLLRIDYEKFRASLDEINELLESIAEDIGLSDYLSEEEIDALEEFKKYNIAMLLPLAYVNDGEVVCLPKGSKEYKVYRAENKSKEPYKRVNKNKIKITLDGTEYSDFKLPGNSVFLVSGPYCIFKTEEDMVKIERNVIKIEEIISFVSGCIDKRDSK